MPLNDPNANLKPGRVPDNERVSLEALLKGNGFTDVDYRKACSADAHDKDLKARFLQVDTVEKRFDSSNITPQKRRTLRSELEPLYDHLLDAAQRYVDDADAAYQAVVEAEVVQLRTENPDKNEMFMNIWRDRSLLITLDARLAKWARIDDFRTDIRTRYKAKYKPGAVQVSLLTAQEQQDLQVEKGNITTQLNAWANLPDDALGCNDIGTWGTSAGGPDANFQATRVSKTVWTELVAWWRGKENTYVTLSDTSSRSLKKFRNVTDGRSRTINYHVDLA